MGRHKEMPGRYYSVVYQDEQEATVNGTYLCPYCDQEATVQFVVPPEGFEILAAGVFFNPLKCEHCDKVTNVRFLKNQRI